MLRQLLELGSKYYRLTVKAFEMNYFRVNLGIIKLKSLKLNKV